MSTASVRPACGIRSLAGAVALALLVSTPLLAQPAGANRIDTISPMAPELAPYGPHPIGVRTLSVTDPKRPDIRNTPPGGPTVIGPRTLTLEAWYPATRAGGATRGGTYAALVRDGRTTVTLHGRAVRDAAPAAGTFPLVIISHGHPGSRYLLSHLAENLASKGYVVVAIDHTDSLYAPEPLFASTLYNRPFDQLFVLNEVARLAMPRSGSFLAGHVDVSRTGIVGYSMGAYGVVNVVGGGFAEGVIDGPDAPPNRLLAERAASSPSFRSTLDPRIRAVIAIGPWGMPRGYWDLEGLKGITTPILFVAGSADDVSGYERGTRAIFEGAVNADRYLLTFADASHNAAAPYPAPVESMTGPATAAFSHHADPVWDTVRMNNILQHFATAYFGRHLLGDASQQAYFDLTPHGRDAVWSVDREGRQQAGHTYWKGFRRGTARGLSLEHRQPAAANDVSAGSQEPMKVAFVDTGNTGRSLSAESLANALIAQKGLRLAVISRGLDVDPFDAKPEANAAALLRRRGIDVGAHTAVQVTPNDVRHADVILTMTARHKATLVERFPEARNKTFTLAEYAAGEGADVPDAWGKPMDVYVSMFQQLDAYVGPALEKAARARR